MIVPAPSTSTNNVGFHQLMSNLEKIAGPLGEVGQGAAEAMNSSLSVQQRVAGYAQATTTLEQLAQQFPASATWTQQTQAQLDAVMKTIQITMPNISNDNGSNSQMPVSVEGGGQVSLYDVAQAYTNNPNEQFVAASNLNNTINSINWNAPYLDVNQQSQINAINEGYQNGSYLDVQQMPNGISWSINENQAAGPSGGAQTKLYGTVGSMGQYMMGNDTADTASASASLQELLDGSTL